MNFRRKVSFVVERWEGVEEEEEEEEKGDREKKEQWVYMLCGLAV